MPRAKGKGKGRQPKGASAEDDTLQEEAQTSSSVNQQEKCASSESEDEIENGCNNENHIDDSSDFRTPQINTASRKRNNPRSGSGLMRSKRQKVNEDSQEDDTPSSSKRKKNSRLVQSSLVNDKHCSSGNNERNSKNSRQGTSKTALAQGSQSSQNSFLTQSKVYSKAGVLKSLQLHNFMCHSNFVHEFHPNLNFITGQNGSGKSALLSGILVALGGKASVTSRTTSLKSLIQKGKHSCSVSVTLLNTNGLLKYGEEITIERRINVSGSSGYRIKSTGGEYDDHSTQGWRPLKRHELDSITMGLNIQIDNPVAILNQEVARSFLRSKDPKVKFDLFYNGTLLSKLEMILEETNTELTDTGEILSRQALIIRDVRQEIDQLKLKCEKIAELQQIKDSLGQLNKEYMWSLVIEQENAAEEISKRVEKAEKELDILGKRVKETEKLYVNLNEESIVREQEEVRECLTDKKREVEGIKAELLAVKKSHANLLAKLKTVTSTITSKEAQIGKLSTQVERLKTEQASRTKQKTDDDEKTLNSMKARKEELQSVVNSIRADIDNFQRASELERDKLQQLENSARNQKMQIESKKRSIVALSNKVNKYSVFGPKMEQLMAKVQANLHKFRKPPRGPLGACFTVKDPKFVVLVEGVLGSSLDSFVVANGQDFQLMKDLINSVYGDRGVSQRSARQSTSGTNQRSPGIIVSQFAEQMYDISRNKASHPSALTLLDVLEVENNDPVVINVLIDSGEVERTLLFQTSIDACKLLKDESICPKSLKCAYSLDWYKITPSPHFGARVMKMRDRAVILRSGRGREKEVIALKSDIQGLEAELNSLEPQRQEILAQEKSFRTMLNTKSSELSNVTRSHLEVSNDIKRHLDKIKQRDKQCDLSSYYEELDELREDVQKEISAREETTKESEAVRPKLMELDGKRKKAVSEFEEINTKLSSFNEVRDELNTKKLQMSNVIKKIKDRMASFQSTKSGLDKELQSRRTTLEEKIEAAMEVSSERVETDRTPSDLHKEFETLKERIRETEAHLGDGEVLRQKLGIERKKYKEYMRQYSPLKKFHKILFGMWESQQNYFERQKFQMSRTLTLFFSALAKQRGYEGRLLVDYTTRELYYFVCPDGDASSRTLKAVDAQAETSGLRSSEQVKQNKQLKRALVEYSLGLSGGERSFSTICFIMAIWQVMECPFYMLDEFDVFMDAFNRKASQLALIAHAKQFCQNQFLLFTPLDLGEVPGADEACVLRLFPPVRGSGSAHRGDQTADQGNSTSQNNSDNDSAPQNSSSRPGRGADSPKDGVENVDPLGGRKRGKVAPRNPKARKLPRRPSSSAMTEIQ